MNVPPFPLAPNVGDWFQNWVWNGARWVATPTTGLRVLAQAFTQAGPYMPSPGLVSLVVECVGGGGAGGQVSGDAASAAGGGGGGSGGYSRKTLPAALVRGGILVTIAAGGLGAEEADGGTTSFGALCVAYGGVAGVGNASAGGLWGQPGSGAPAGVGDVALPGNPGFPGTSMMQSATDLTTTVVSGGTGGAIIGGAGSSWVMLPGNASDGVSAPGWGAGGGGGMQNQVAASRNGGDGGAGLCIVTEYCWGDRDQPLSEWSPPVNVNLNVTSRPKPWPPGQPGPWWPPGWPPGWGPNPPWPPGWGPWPRGTLPQGQEFEAGVEPFGQDQEPEDP